MLKKIGLLAICAVSAFAMHSVELNVNDKDLEIGAKLDMGQFNDALEPNTIFLGAKFLHGDYEHSDYENISYLNEKSMEDYSEINFLMRRKLGTTGLSIGLGVKVNHTKNFTTVPLGAELGYELPVGDLIPMRLSAALYYAPSVLSMSDAKNFFEYRFEYEIEVIKNANILVGYRSLDTNYEDMGVAKRTLNINYNHSPYVGFKFAF